MIAYDELHDALVRIAREQWIPMNPHQADRATKALLYTIRTAHIAAPRTSLSPREHQVLERMACGLSNLQIAQELFMSEDTVKTHARKLFRKLGAFDRTHAVALGYEEGHLVGTGVVASRRVAA